MNGPRGNSAGGPYPFRSSRMETFLPPGPYDQPRIAPEQIDLLRSAVLRDLDNRVQELLSDPRMFSYSDHPLSTLPTPPPPHDTWWSHRVYQPVPPLQPVAPPPTPYYAPYIQPVLSYPAPPGQPHGLPPPHGPSFEAPPGLSTLGPPWPTAAALPTAPPKFAPNTSLGGGQPGCSVPESRIHPGGPGRVPVVGRSFLGGLRGKAGRSRTLRLEELESRVAALEMERGQEQASVLREQRPTFPCPPAPTHMPVPPASSLLASEGPPTFTRMPAGQPMLGQSKPPCPTLPPPSFSYGPGGLPSTRPCHPAPPSMPEWPREPPVPPSGASEVEPALLVPQHNRRSDAYGEEASGAAHQRSASELSTGWLEIPKASTGIAVKGEGGQSTAESVKKQAVTMVEEKTSVGGDPQASVCSHTLTGARTSAPTLPRNDSGAYSDKSAQTVDRRTTVEDVPDES